MSRSKKVFIVAIFVTVLFAIAGYCVYIAPKPEDDAWKRTLEPTKLPERIDTGTSYSNEVKTFDVKTLDEHITINETPREVNFCGINFRVKQIIVDNVDVTQRIAKMATENAIQLEYELGRTAPIPSSDEIARMICGNVHLAAAEGETLEADIISNNKSNFNGKYPLHINGEMFFVDTQTGKIYLIDGFDGSTIGSIGTLK